MVSGNDRDRLNRERPERPTRRALERLERREREDRFWHWVLLPGSVGWPIVLLAVGGTLLGRYLDRLWDTGPRLTLTLMISGTVLGSWAAFRSLGDKGP